jgi:hypothetical protein
VNLPKKFTARRTLDKKFSPLQTQYVDEDTGESYDIDNPLIRVKITSIEGGLIGRYQYIKGGKGDRIPQHVIYDYRKSRESYKKGGKKIPATVLEDGEEHGSDIDVGD